MVGRVVVRVEERRRERRVRVVAVDEEERKGTGWIGDRGEAMRVVKGAEGDWSGWNLEARGRAGPTQLFFLVYFFFFFNFNIML